MKHSSGGRVSEYFQGQSNAEGCEPIKSLMYGCIQGLNRLMGSVRNWKMEPVWRTIHSQCGYFRVCHALFFSCILSVSCFLLEETHFNTYIVQLC